MVLKTIRTAHTWLRFPFKPSSMGYWSSGLFPCVTKKVPSPKYWTGIFSTHLAVRAGASMCCKHSMWGTGVVEVLLTMLQLHFYSLCYTFVVRVTAGGDGQVRPAGAAA
jgi:hypothetical protein